jgi:AcrR family transcriptional regulator
MTVGSERVMRRDAARNRDRLLAAARQLFAEQGPDVALEEVARAAGVSRATLYRNFATREELAVTVYEDNVALVEQRAAQLREVPDGVVALFDFVLEMMRGYRALAPILSGASRGWYTGLSARITVAFEPLLDQGRTAGVVLPGTGVLDVLLAFSMADGVLANQSVTDGVGHDGGIADPGPEAATDSDARVRMLLHRALFTSARAGGHSASQDHSAGQDHSADHGLAGG